MNLALKSAVREMHGEFFIETKEMLVAESITVSSVQAATIVWRLVSRRERGDRDGGGHDETYRQEAAFASKTEDQAERRHRRCVRNLIASAGRTWLDAEGDADAAT